jgi:putative SOS response-associated peptidase YedK
MCGRYDAYFEINDYALALDAVFDGELTKSANVAPTEPAPILLTEEEARRIRVARFGFPRMPGPHAPPINARAETVAKARPFREAFRERRCLVLASAFYEWKPGKEGKQPYRFSSPTGEPLTFAGIYEMDGDVPGFFAILTAPAGDAVGAVHTREPLIVPAHLREAWLSSDKPENTLARVIAERANHLASWAVSKAVGSPRNKGPELREPVDPEKGRQGSLFPE